MIQQDNQACFCAINAADDLNYCKLQNNNPNFQVYDVAKPFGDSCDEVDGFLMEMETGLYTEPFAGSPEYDVRPANPIVCNIESYLHIGSIVDTGECECPLYDAEKLYQDTTNYIDMPSDRTYDADWMLQSTHYKQYRHLGSAGSLSACKTECNNIRGCVEVTWGGGGAGVDALGGASNGRDCFGFIYK